MTAVENSETQNERSQQNDPGRAKKILTKVARKLHIGKARIDNEHKGPNASRPLVNVVKQACRKLHIGKDCRWNENGTCQLDSLQTVQNMLIRETTAPISAEESAIIQSCVDSMTPEQAKILEESIRPQQPEIGEEGDEAETSRSAPAPSGRVESGSHETDHTENAEQGGLRAEAFGSTLRPSRSVISSSHNTDEDESDEQEGHHAKTYKKAKRMKWMRNKLRFM